jgi:hypothetical protein
MSSPRPTADQLRAALEAGPLHTTHRIHLDITGPCFDYLEAQAKQLAASTTFPRWSPEFVATKILEETAMNAPRLTAPVLEPDPLVLLPES